MAKSRREVLYDKGKKDAEKEPEPESKPAEEPDNGGGDAGDASATIADMFKRHEADRRTTHGNQRTEHRAIEAEGGDDMLMKKLAAHRRQRTEMDQMHERHERELIEKLSSLEKSEDKGEEAA